MAGNLLPLRRRLALRDLRHSRGGRPGLARLTQNGGQPGPCGWLTDPYGLSWQVVPAALGEMMGDPEQGNSRAVMDAMLQMSKLDIAELRRAYATPVEAGR